MKQHLRALAFLAALQPSWALAQSAPATMPYHTVYGRLGAAPGDTGPGQAIPFSTLSGQLLNGLCTTNNAIPAYSTALGRWACISTLPTSQIPAFAGGDVTGAGGSLVLTIGANKVTRAMEAQGIARSVIGVTGNALANVADIQGTTSQWFGINAAGTAAVFQTLAGDCTGPITAIVCTKVNGVSESLGGTFTTAAAFTQAGAFATTITSTATTNSTLPAGTHTLVAPDINQTWTSSQGFNDSTVNLNGSTSGSVTLKAPAIAGASSFRFPTGATDLSASGGASQVVKQTSAGGALSVAQLAMSDITDTAWTTFTPSPTCGTATFTTTSARSKTYSKTTHIEVDFTITAIGAGCTTTLSFTLPNTANAGGGIAGREFGISGKGYTCDVRAASATATCSLADFTAHQVNAHMVASGVYENQ